MIAYNTHNFWFDDNDVITAQTYFAVRYGNVQKGIWNVAAS